MIEYKRLESLSTQEAVQKLINREYSGDIESFVDALDGSLNRLLRADLKKAERYVALTGGLAKFLPPQWEARLISQQARLSLWCGDYGSAKREYELALELFRRHRDALSAARLRKGLVEVLMYLGEYDAAISTGRTALRYFRSQELKTDEAQLLTNMGNVYHRSDRNKLALQYYDKARKIFARNGGVPLAIVDFNRANIFANLNNLRKAKRLYLNAAAIYKKAGWEISDAQARYSVAYLSFLESKYAEALEGFEQVYESFVKLGDSKTAAITLLDLVELEVHLHLFGSAVYLGRQVINDLKKLRLSYEQGKANYFVAWAMIEMDEPAEAQKYLKNAESVFNTERNELWLGMVRLARAQLAVQRKDFSEALKTTRQAEKHFNKSGDKRRKNDALLVQIEALAAKNDSDADVEQRALALERSGLVKYQQYRLASILGEYHLRQNQNRKAVRDFRKALKTAEEMLQGLNQDEIRVLFASDVTEAYSRLARAYLAEQNARSALIEVLRGMAVLNLQSRVRSAGRTRGSLQQQVDTLRTQIARMQRLDQPGRRVTAPSGYRELEQRLWRLQRAARSSASGFPHETGISTQQIESVVDRLQNRTLIHYHSHGDNVGVFLARDDGIRHINLKVKRSEFQRVLRKTYFLLERGLFQRGDSSVFARALNHYRHTLYDHLISQIADQVGNDEIVLAVDREFLQIPFSILLADDGESLHEKFHFTLLVNPLDLNRREVRFRSTQSNTIIGSDSESLPLVRAECEAIHQIFSSAQVLTGDAASTEAVLEALRQSDGFVHIAAHAARAAENPLFSRILMANGPLFPFEINGRIKAHLVTLSGCQTAAPGLYYGNSFSLAKAFYQAGGRAVLASLWSVADDIAMEFMKEFYAFLSTSGSIKDSYAQAVQKIRTLTDNPAHWGAFVLLGAVG